MAETRRFRLPGAAVTAALLSTLALAGCGRRPAADPGYLAEIEQWREHRIAALTSDEGWLTVVGLYWLRPGPNSFGSAPDNDVVIPAAELPARAGTFELTPDGTVTVRVAEAVDVTLDGEPVTERSLADDRGGAPDVLRVGSVRFHTIRREDQVAVRVKDGESEARRNFRGLVYFPIDPAYRVTGRLERYPEPRRVLVPAAQGPSQTMFAPGLIRFNLRGAACSLEPLLSSPDDDELMLILRDATSGKQTYGAGRFLYAPRPAAGSDEVVLDFNRAQNPPCAFTAYATCPLPPPGNTLPVAVEAGEKDYEH